MLYALLKTKTETAFKHSEYEQSQYQCCQCIPFQFWLIVDKNDVTEVSLMMGIMRRKLIYSSIIITLYYAYFYDYFRFYFVTDKKRYKRSKANREYQASTEHGSTSANRNLISVPPATVITLQIMLSFTSQSCAILQVRIYP